MAAPCNCYALRQASRRASQFYDQVLAPSGLRSTQFAMLREIDKRGPIALLPLARHMVMDRATLGHNIRLLEANGYVKLTVGDDRRNREVRLTPSGRKILAEALPLWEKAHAAFEAEIGVRQSAELRNMLDRVAQAEFSLAEN